LHTFGFERIETLADDELRAAAADVSANPASSDSTDPKLSPGAPGLPTLDSLEAAAKSPVTPVASTESAKAASQAALLQRPGRLRVRFEYFQEPAKDSDNRCESVSVSELQHAFVTGLRTLKIAQQQPPGLEHAWSWSRWRRKRQYQDRICHYQRRGHDPHMRLQY